ncbi:MAG: GIY-YIG nuclease family protein [Microbacterium sp.]|nr:GIY-YIG nuclease family protein [Microbacterium sp.]
MSHRRRGADVGRRAYGDGVIRDHLLPGPCALCGALRGTRIAGALHCADCDWRYGDAPDADLPLPRIDVVYYLRYDRRVKIGTTRRPRQRLSAIRHDELLAFERGDRAVEKQRHRQFADVREGGEWFMLSGDLVDHIAALRAAGAPWTLYGRWLSDALR